MQNVLTSARIILVPVFLFLLLEGLRYLATGLFALLAITDWLDGYIARHTGQVTLWGKVMDPIADKILVLGALVGLVELGKVSSFPVLLIGGRELLVSGFRLLERERTGEAFPVSFLSKWKTAIQMGAILLYLLEWPGRGLLLWGAVAITLWTGWEYGKHVSAKAG